jgi:type II secretory pathway component PulF
VRFDVPLPEALRLSAGSTGDRRLVTAAESTARQIEAGASLQTALSQTSSIPGFLRWLMIAGDRQSRLAPTLDQAATVYRQRAMLRSEWIQRLFPVAVVLILGGGATMFYALTVFMPMSMLWQRLGG